MPACKRAVSRVWPGSSGVLGRAQRHMLWSGQEVHEVSCGGAPTRRSTVQMLLLGSETPLPGP